MAVGNLSMIFLLGFAVVCGGLLLHIIGVATNEWATSSSNTFGLWKACALGICVSFTSVSSKMEACQAFGIIGVIAGGLALLLALVQIVFSVTGKSTSGKLPVLSLCACLLAGVAIFICIVVWGAAIQDEIKIAYDVGYSYILCIIANFLIPAGGFLLYLGGRS